MLTAIVLTKNESALIEPCLQSLQQLADEIVLVDDCSTDDTVEKAKKYTPLVHVHSLEDFSKQRNFALSLVHGDWLLYVDADERLTKELAEEIRRVINNDNRPYTAYALPRYNIHLGKLQKFGFYPDYQKRLFWRPAFIKWKNTLHEQPDFQGQLGHLTNPLIHLSHRDIYSMMIKSIQFTDLEAHLRLQAGHPPIVWWRLLRVCAGEFLHQLRLGRWRNGLEGWIEILYQTFNMLIIYVRLWELQRKKPLGETYYQIDQKLIKENFDHNWLNKLE